MKSSPKSEDVANTTESKTPTSAKKLVQARLPFKSLSGCEPPNNATNNAATISATTTTITVNTPTDPKGSTNRKRKQPAPTDDVVRAAKINRRSQGDDDIVLVSSSIAESKGDDISVVHDQNDGIQTAGCSDTFKSIENTKIDNNPKSERPKSKRLLNKMEAESEASSANRARRSANSDHFQIKLPMTKKAKGASKKGKVSRKLSDDVPMDVDDNEIDGEKLDDTAECVVLDETSESLSLSGSEGHNKSELNDNDSKTTDELNESIVLDESYDADNPSTPDNRKMTPKQLQRRADSEKKLLDRKFEREERERLKKLERDEKGNVSQLYFFS